jgi:hypothetical protein
MKLKNRPAILLSLIMLTMLFIQVRAPAQEEPAPPPHEECGPEMAPPDQPDPYTRRWLEQVKQRNPEEFSELVTLLQEDPQAFHRELSMRLGRKRLRQCFRDNPKMLNAYQQLSKEEKDRIAAGFFQPPPSGKNGAMRRGGPPRRHERHEDDEPFTKNLRPLIEKYKSATDPQQKEMLRSELLTELGKSFDQRTRERMQSIIQLQQQLDHLKEKLDARQANRDLIIQNRFDQLTRDDALKW